MGLLLILQEHFGTIPNVGPHSNLFQSETSERFQGMWLSRAMFFPVFFFFGWLVDSCRLNFRYAIQTCHPGAKKPKPVQWNLVIASVPTCWFQMSQFLPFGTPEQRSNVHANTFNRFTGFRHYALAQKNGALSRSDQEPESSWHESQELPDIQIVQEPPCHEQNCNEGMECEKERSSDCSDNEAELGECGNNVEQNKEQQDEEIYARNVWARLQEPGVVAARKVLQKALFQGRLRRPTSAQLVKAIAPYLFHLIVVVCSRPACEFEAILDGRSPLRDFLISGYLLGWLGHLVQRPHKKTGICPIIHGLPGTGKNFFIDLLIKHVFGSE